MVRSGFRYCPSPFRDRQNRGYGLITRADGKDVCWLLLLECMGIETVDRNQTETRQKPALESDLLPFGDHPTLPQRRCEEVRLKGAMR